MLASLKKNRWSYMAAAAFLLLLVLLPTQLLADKTSLLILIGIYTMVTLGLCLLMGYTGQVSLGQAAFFGTGAYLSAILSTRYDLNPWLAMLMAAAATGVFAYLISYPIFRLRGNYLAMATLGLGIIIWILFRELSQYTGGPDGLTGIPNFAIGGFVFDDKLERYFLVWGFCVASLLVAQNIVGSRTGRALRGIHGSEPAAESIGINVAQFKMKIFVLGAVYASLAGSLYAHHAHAIGPNAFDFMASVMVITMAAVGGLASIWGAVFGAATITYISQDAIVELGKSYPRLASLDVVLYGLILMLVMIFLPKGLFVSLGEALDVWRKRLARKRAPA
ncbi:MAG: branched-chain amino acid ABC transporter permease [Dehalococcoidia bacterium]|nr:branched-chain amino acid ABC transporter permease [Dehalococcoidia bacterium]